MKVELRPLAIQNRFDESAAKLLEDLEAAAVRFDNSWTECGYNDGGKAAYALAVAREAVESLICELMTREQDLIAHISAV